MEANVTEFASRKDLDGLGGKVGDLDKKVAVTDSKVEALEKGSDHTWAAIKDLVKENKIFTDTMNKMKIELTRNTVIIGIVQLVVTAALIKYFIK
jgi:hypothetical protein